jgi:hypothetical protein
VLGFLPPTAPIAMPVLYASGDAPVWQVVIAAVLCAAGTMWMARIAARIYLQPPRQALRPPMAAIALDPNKCR